MKASEKVAIVSLCLIVPLAVYGGPSLFRLIHASGAPKTPEILIVDQWWNHDYASNSCKLPDSECNSEMAVAEVSEFESKFYGAFGSDAACHGIRLEKFGYTASPLTDHPTGWQLMIDFSLGKSRQEWSLVSFPENKKVLRGNGTYTSMAHSVCNLIHSKGGTIAD